MKFLLAVTLLAALSTTVVARICKHCTDPNDLECSLVEDVICPWGKMCISASVRVDNNGSVTTRIYKDCVGRSLCPSTGRRSISSNLGEEYSLANVKCCSSPNCNDETLPFPDESEHQPNRRFCPGDNVMVECRGAEDTCFEAELLKLGEEVKVYGCGSDDVCDASRKLESLPFLERVGTVSETPTCSNAPAQTRRVCLVCDDPADPTCTTSTAQECPSEDDKCVSLTYSDGRIYRGCGTPSICPEVGTVTFSANSGSSSGLVTAVCCRDNECNLDNPELPVEPDLSTRLCSICFTGTSVCSFMARCNELEDTCFSTYGNVSGNVVPLLGCASSSVCSNPASFESILFPNTPRTGPLSCCNSTGCNDPTRVPVDPSTTLPPAVTTAAKTTAGPGFGSPGLDKDLSLLLGLDSGLGSALDSSVSQQMGFLVQQMLLYLQQLQIFLLQCPLDQQLLLQPLLLLIQQLLVYVQLLVQQGALI
ncbi:unnamed protein product [Ophioblennius macclurei]